MSEAERPAIEVRQVRKRFGSQAVLEGLDLTVRRGETVVVLGRSGTGKSILLKLIVGLQKVDAGSIFVHGEDITRLPIDDLNRVRAQIGFLFQEGALYDSLSIEANVAFPLERQDRLSGAERRERVRELLSLVGMEKDARKRPAELSGGMKKRVGLARALALEPDVLLFDEPTAGLDPITAHEIETLMRKLREKDEIAAVVVTHDLHGARALADRLAFLHEGRIVAEGSFDDLRRAGHPVVTAFLGDGVRERT